MRPDLRDELQSALGASYRIERALRGGGTARVFLAVDAALDRRQPIVAHITEHPRPLREVRPDVPAALAEFVMSCLEKSSADRPQSAAGIVRALDHGRIPGVRWAAGRSASRAPDSSPSAGHAREPHRREAARAPRPAGRRARRRAPPAAVDPVDRPVPSDDAA